MDMFPFILDTTNTPLHKQQPNCTSLSHDYDHDDTEVPCPTLQEFSTRRTRAQTHVQAKLVHLQTEQLQEKLCLRRDSGVCVLSSLGSPGLVFTPEAPELGIVSPKTWRVLDNEILDRTWLREINPYAFDARGVLKRKYRGLERPRGLLFLYWAWLKGEEVKGAEEWATDGREKGLSRSGLTGGRKGS